MATILKPGDYEEIQDPASTAAASTAKPLAPTQYEELPQYAHGLSPDAPLNKSPLRFEDRFNLALGNKAGNVKKLQTMFEDVQDDGEGNLVVKKDGLWHRVDGNTFGDADAWSATKGIMKGLGAGVAALSDFTGTTGGRKLAKSIVKGDAVAEETLGELAENAPMGAAIGTAVAAGALTGGLGLAGFAAAGANAAGAASAAGILETARTSLGRLEGTYEATPEQQLKDIGFEMLLNFGGTFIPGAVKPTAQLLGRQMPSVAKRLGSIPAASREVIKQFYGKLTGVGAENIDTLLAHGDDVGGMMRKLGEQFPDSAGYVDEVRRIQIRAVKETAETADQMMKSLWNRNQEAVVNHVGASFTAGADDIAHTVLSSSLDSGFTYVQKAGSTSPLPLDAALELITTSGGKLPAGYRFATRTPQQLEKFILEGGGRGLEEAGSIVFGPKNREALKMVADFYNTVGKLGSLKGKTGPEAAKQLLQMSKVLDDITWQFGSVADDMGLSSLKVHMAKAHEMVRGAVAQRFSGAGVAEKFSKLNGEYSMMKGTMADILEARQKYSRGIAGEEVFDRLLTKITSRAGANVPAKDTFNGALKLATERRLPEAAKLAQLQKTVRVAQAARAFNPLLGDGMLAQGSLTFAAGSALFNPAMAATLAAGAAIRSPRLAMTTTNLVNTAWKGKQFLSTLTGKGVERLVSDPAALNAFVATIDQTPMIQEGVKETLLGGTGVK